MWSGCPFHQSRNLKSRRSHSCTHGTRFLRLPIQHSWRGFVVKGICLLLWRWGKRPVRQSSGGWGTVMVSEEGRCVSRAIYDLSRPQNELYKKYAMDWKHRRMPTSRSEKDWSLRIAAIQGQLCILKRIDGGELRNTLISHFSFRHVSITLLIGDLPPDISVLLSKDRQTC